MLYRIPFSTFILHLNFTNVVMISILNKVYTCSFRKILDFHLSNGYLNKMMKPKNNKRFVKIISMASVLP